MESDWYKALIPSAFAWNEGALTDIKFGKSFEFDSGDVNGTNISFKRWFAPSSC